MEEIKYKEYTIEIVPDEDARNPREEWDNACLMICFHKRYKLGDKHDFDFHNYNNWDEMEADIIKILKPVVIKRLRLYDHSGITISTSDRYPYTDVWDAGTVGFVIISRCQALKEYGGKRITKEIKEKAERLLDSEVKTYDEYLRGDVYGYIVKDPNGNAVDSCYGFYGDPEESGLLDEARNIVDHQEATEEV